VAYAAFLNRLHPGKFKFSLAESKVTVLIEALGRAQSFIQATKICTGDEPPRQGNKKRLGEECDVQLDNAQRKVMKGVDVSTRALAISYGN